MPCPRSRPAEASFTQLQQEVVAAEAELLTLRPQAEQVGWACLCGGGG